jgi:hypothetical protein
VLSFFGISLPVVQLGGGLIVISTGRAKLNQKDGDDRAARRTVTCADAVSQAFLSISICSSFKSPSIWRSETFPRLLLCDSDCSLDVSRASTNCGWAPAKECGFDPGENIQDWGRIASAPPKGLFQPVQSPVVRRSPFSSGCGAGIRIGGGRFRADHFRGGYTTADPVFVEVFVLKTSRNVTGRTRRHKTLGLKLQRSAGLHALFICQPEGLLT